MNDPKSVDPDLVDVAGGLAVLNGDAALYDRILAKAKEAKVPEEYYRYLYGLAGFADPKLLTRTLELAVSPEVRSQDAPQLIASVLGNPAGRELAWNFIKTRWDDIAKHVPNFGGAGALVGTAGVFCSAEKRDEVQHFFSEHKIPSAERLLKQTVNRINDCIELRTQQAPKMAEWLKQRPGAAAGK